MRTTAGNVSPHSCMLVSWARWRGFAGDAVEPALPLPDRVMCWPARLTKGKVKGPGHIRGELRRLAKPRHLSDFMGQASVAFRTIFDALPRHHVWCRVGALRLSRAAGERMH